MSVITVSNNDDIRIYIPKRKKVIEQENVIIKTLEENLDYDKLGEKIIEETAKQLGSNEITLNLKLETNNK